VCRNSLNLLPMICHADGTRVAVNGWSRTGGMLVVW
jgi:hypothetical protein